MYNFTRYSGISVDPRERLSNHLTAHGVRLEYGSRSTDISDVLRSMDWAMVLGMISARDASLLLAKYCDDREEERKARIWWLQELIEVASEKGWRRPKPMMIYGLANCSMDEHLGRNVVCSSCNGTKELVIDRKVIQCEDCEGLGWILYSDQRYAEAIGCTIEQYRSSWVERVLYARRALYRWEMNAAERLMAKVAGME